MIVVDENLKPETFVKTDRGHGNIDAILSNVFFGNGYLIASEGHMLLYSKVKMDKGDEYCLISKEQYKQARKSSKGHIGVHFFVTDGEIKFADETTSPRVNDVKRKDLIDFAKMISKLIGFTKSRLGGTKSVALLNKEYFKKCLDAFGKDEQVKWLFGKTAFDPMIIKPPVNENHAFALLLGMQDSSVKKDTQGEYQKAREEFYAQFKKEEPEPETKKRRKK